MGAKPKQINSAKELREVLSKIPYDDKAHRNSIVCSLVGHSKIETICFGYHYCARCGDQVGDTLASVYPGAETAVVVGHDCPICRTNYKALTWKDKLYAPNPFKKDSVKPQLKGNK